MAEASEEPLNWRDSPITDEDMAHLRAHVGKPIEMRPWNSEVTYDNIWHYASGIGDDNPMWWDEDYARRSPWGRMIAPPCYLYGHSNGGQLPHDTRPYATDGFLPGKAGLWASTKWRWFRPAAVGEKVRLFWEIKEVIDHPHSKFGGRSVSQLEV